MVPFFGWALLVDDGQSVLWRCIAWALFVVAMITDKVDGDIARSRNLVTNFGKIADPIADKALTGMAFVGLSIIGELWWWVTILVLVREWGITLLRLWVIRHGVMAAGRGGKLKTVLQTVRAGLLHPADQDPAGRLGRGRRRPVGHLGRADGRRGHGDPGRPGSTTSSRRSPSVARAVVGRDPRGEGPAHRPGPGRRRPRAPGQVSARVALLPPPLRPAARRAGWPRRRA